jgi:hypothetical protein
VAQGGPEVEVSVERYETSIGTELGWIREAATIVAKDTATARPILWSGTVNLPAAQQGHQISSAIQRYRLVIKEFETLPADRTGLETSLRIGPPFSLLWSTKRLVYADQIEL